MACKLAVIGNARKAPRAPNSEPKISTHRKAIAGFKSMVRCEIFGDKIRFSICWYTTMNTTTITAYVGPCDAHAKITGRAPPRYEPIVGTNCEVRPQNSASGSQYGT